MAVCKAASLFSVRSKANHRFCENIARFLHSFPDVTVNTVEVDAENKLFESTLTNVNGMSVKVTNYGATIMSVKVPNGDDHVDLILGYDNAKQYVSGKLTNFGSIVGRYANRIAKGQFTVDGNSYQLETNNGPNHLHGGSDGYFSKIFQVKNTEIGDESATVTYEYVSPDGDANYPSELTVTASISLNNSNQLTMTYDAENTGDKTTIVNLCNHGYWNIAGFTSGSDGIRSLTLQSPAEKFTPVDENLTITGEMTDVAGTVWDLRNGANLGQKFNETEKGFDLNYILTPDFSAPDKLHLAATLTDPKSGRSMVVETNAPGVQVYTGFFMNAEQFSNLKRGYTGEQFGCVCLETQNWPDAVNHPESFPSPVLPVGKKYSHVACHTFNF